MGFGSSELGVFNKRHTTVAFRASKTNIRVLYYVFSTSSAALCFASKDCELNLNYRLSAEVSSERTDGS